MHCVEKNITFESIISAANWIGAPKTNIINACKHPERIVKGCHFRFVSEECVSEEKRQQISAKNSKPVLCVETGIIYTSIKAAAKAIGAASNAISLACLYEQGYHWRRVQKY